MLYRFRVAARGILLWIARMIAVPVLSPNHLTLLSILPALAAAYFIANNSFLIAVFFVALAFFIDALDGALAEVKNQKTPFGNYLDAVVDRVVEAIIYAGLFFLFPIPAFFAFALGIIGTHTKALAGTIIEADNRDWPGLGGRPERALLLLGGLLVSAFVPLTGEYATLELVLFLILMVVLVGNVQRLLFARVLFQKG